MIVLFCGSRKWTDSEAIKADMETLTASDLVVHGGARGADSLAGEAAKSLGIHAAQVDALWDIYGKSAGPRRNSAMLKLPIEKAFAYYIPGSRGTTDMVKKLEAKSIPVVLRYPLDFDQPNE